MIQAQLDASANLRGLELPAARQRVIWVRNAPAAKHQHNTEPAGGPAGFFWLTQEGTTSRVGRWIGQGVRPMSKATRKTPKPMTVGDLISELCRWPDHALVKFRHPLQHQELRFDHIESGTKGIVEIELAAAHRPA